MKVSCLAATFFLVSEMIGSAKAKFGAQQATHSERQLVGCNVANPEWVGDGWCDQDGGYNTEECNWDGGDCCSNTCVQNTYDCTFEMDCKAGPTNLPNGHQCEGSGQCTSGCCSDQGGSSDTFELPPMRHVPNTYCAYYDNGGDGDCPDGKSFTDVWQQCEDDGSDVCMGVMWNSCQGPTSDTSVNGAWKLMTAGQEIGTAEIPTATCGGKNQARGHWDVFARLDLVHVPNTYCAYYDNGGDGDCSDGKSFTDVWQQCEDDGSDVCMGVMWNSCQGPTSDTSVNGAWKLMTAGQEVGTAEIPTATCGGKNQALGHWDVFVRSESVGPGLAGSNTCEVETAFRNCV